MYSSLPAEIWLLIIEDLPNDRSQFFKLKSLNSFFLNYWMDLKWKEVDIDMRSPDLAIRLLNRMVDPFVATRPRSLSICLNSKPLYSKPIVDTALTALLHSLPFLPNISSLTIGLSQSHILVTLFRTIASSSIATTVRELSLSGLVHTFAPLAEYSAQYTPFKNLTSLYLSQTKIAVHLSEDDSNFSSCSLTLAPFLLSIAPTLQDLRISNSLYPIIPSPIFNPLHFTVPFPNLKSLQMDFVMYPRRNLDPDEEEQLSVWLTDFVNNNSQFPSLQTLEISYPSNTSAAQAALLTVVKRTAFTVSDLTIRKCLTQMQVKQVINALTEANLQQEGITTRKEPSALKSLSIEINRLSVSFLDLLARKLPQLEKLSLSITEIVGSDQYSFYELLHHRRYDPAIIASTPSTQDVLHAWKLHDLLIELTQLRKYTMITAMRAVAGAVPSVVLELDEDIDVFDYWDCI